MLQTDPPHQDSLGPFNSKHPHTGKPDHWDFPSVAGCLPVLPSSPFGCRLWPCALPADRSSIRAVHMHCHGHHCCLLCLCLCLQLGFCALVVVPPTVLGVVAPGGVRV